MSSLLCRVETLSEKRGARQAVRAFARERGIDSLVTMTVTLDAGGKMRKELLVFTEEAERSTQIREFLEGPRGGFLRLQQASVPAELGSGLGVGSGNDVGECLGGEGGDADGAGGLFLQWEMGNVTPSRKQIAPAITSFYESLM